jgi:hypothetical protein
MIQHPQLDGPYIVGASTNRWNTTPGFYAAHSAALSPYRIATLPLVRVWEGDDPSNPTQTVALAFPDAATAEATLVGCGATLV